MTKQREPSFYRYGCAVSIPTRVSISVLDMNCFSPGRVGGGNAGFAIDLTTQLSVTVCDPIVPDLTPAKDAGSRSDLICQRSLQVWRHIFKTHVPCRFTLTHILPAHVGLASSMAMHTAMLCGLNWLNGLPLSEAELLLFATSTYMELAGDTMVSALTTGLCTFLSLYGGFAVIDHLGQPEVRLSAPPWKYVAGVPHLGEGKVTAETEIAGSYQRGKVLDKSDGRRKSEIVKDILVPAIGGSDFVAAREAIHIIQGMGSKLAEIDQYGSCLHELLQTLRSDPSLCVMMTAVGPCLICISETSTEQAQKVILNAGWTIIGCGDLDNSGLKIRTL
jgi:predicted sugar kinase